MADVGRRDGLIARVAAVNPWWRIVSGLAVGVAGPVVFGPGMVAWVVIVAAVALIVWGAL